MQKDESTVSNDAQRGTWTRVHYVVCFAYTLLSGDRSGTVCVLRLPPPQLSFPSSSARMKAALSGIMYTICLPLALRMAVE